MYHNGGDLKDYDFNQMGSIAKVQPATLLYVTTGYKIKEEDY